MADAFVNLTDEQIGILINSKNLIERSND